MCGISRDFIFKIKLSHFSHKNLTAFKKLPQVCNFNFLTFLNINSVLCKTSIKWERKEIIRKLVSLCERFCVTLNFALKLKCAQGKQKPQLNFVKVEIFAIIMKEKILPDASALQPHYLDGTWRQRVFASVPPGFAAQWCHSASYSHHSQYSPHYSQSLRQLFSQPLLLVCTISCFFYCGTRCGLYGALDGIVK